MVTTSRSDEESDQQSLVFVADTQERLHFVHRVGVWLAVGNLHPILWLQQATDAAQRVVLEHRGDGHHVGLHRPIGEAFGNQAITEGYQMGVSPVIATGLGATPFA